MIKISLHEIPNSKLPMQHPLRNQAMPFLNSRFREIKEASRNRKSTHQQPNRGEQSSGMCFERMIAIANSGNRHDCTVKRIEQAECLELHHHDRAGDDANDWNAERHRHFHSNPHAVPVLRIQDILFRSLEMGAFDCGEEEVFLFVEHVGYHSGEEGVDEAESDKDEDAGEEFREWCRGDYVAIADGAHCYHAEVERVHE